MHRLLLGGRTGRAALRGQEEVGSPPTSAATSGASNTVRFVPYTLMPVLRLAGERLWKFSRALQAGLPPFSSQTGLSGSLGRGGSANWWGLIRGWPAQEPRWEVVRVDARSPRRLRHVICRGVGGVPDVEEEVARGQRATTPLGRDRRRLFDMDTRRFVLFVVSFVVANIALKVWKKRGK